MRASSIVKPPIKKLPTKSQFFIDQKFEAELDDAKESGSSSISGSSTPEIGPLHLECAND